MPARDEKKTQAYINLRQKGVYRQDAAKKAGLSLATAERIDKREHLPARNAKKFIPPAERPAPDGPAPTPGVDPQPAIEERKVDTGLEVDWAAAMGITPEEYALHEGGLPGEGSIPAESWIPDVTSGDLPAPPEILAARQITASSVGRVWTPGADEGSRGYRSPSATHLGFDDGQDPSAELHPFKGTPYVGTQPPDLRYASRETVERFEQQSRKGVNKWVKKNQEFRARNSAGRDELPGAEPINYRGRARR